jgi:hypothetical protein
MSTTTAPYGATLDVSTTSRVPASRLVRVELRKMVDTRAGMWLLITIGIVIALAEMIFVLAAHESEKTMGNFLGFAVAPLVFILPVLGILLITQEWGQRTGMVTFVLEPHRSRVLVSKIWAAIILGIAAVVTAFLVATIATALFGNSNAWTDVAAFDFVKIAIVELLVTLQGLALGLLFLNSPTAIVLFFVLPRAVAIVANVWTLISDKAAWIDLSTAYGALFDSGSPTGTEWAQLAVTATIWVVLPFTIGLWRVLRAEVK